MEISLADNIMHLSAERTLWWPSASTLFLSDVHLGKATHFRKAGISISGKTGIVDLDRIAFQLRSHQPKRIVFLGDLFHSEYNLEWEKFIDLRKHFSETQFILVEGNHDIMDPSFYNRAKVDVIEEGYVEADIEWRHHPRDSDSGMQLCGHIHPGVHIVGKARQSITLPCFVHEPHKFVFPAFGRLTGKVKYEGPKGTKYYAIAGSELLTIPHK